MSDGLDIYTDVGLAKIRDAAGSDSQVAIAFIALGDGNGANYDPTHDQTALRRELVRLPIERRTQIEPNGWRVKATFAPDTPAMRVREMGFFDADGDMIFMWAGADIGKRETGVIEYPVDHVLSFTGIDDGLVIVAAPDDDLFDHVVGDIEAQALLTNMVMDQQLTIRQMQAAS